VSSDELIEDPPVYTALASFYVPLDHILEGEHESSQLFVMDWPVVSPKSPTPVIEVNKINSYILHNLNE